MFARLKHLKVFFKDPDKKPTFKIVKECLHYGLLKKELPIDYFRKFLYRTDVIDYTPYLSLKEYYSIINAPQISIPEIKSILNNKLSFALYAEKHKLPVPKLFGYNFKSFFYTNSTLTTIGNKDALFEFFEALLKTAPAEALFLKRIEGEGGVGCILLNKHQLKEQIEQHADSLLRHSYLFQDLVKQHPVVSKVNPNSVNTLRIDTYVDPGQNIQVLSVLMRFGVGNSIVDNVHSGGFYIAVNIETEKLQGKGRQDVVEGGRVFLKHPDSGMLLDGYQIPFVKAACALAINASKHLPNGIVGWDIAITETGPLIIEGNKFPSMHLTDVAYGGYCKHPVIQRLLKEIKHE
jgi:hypothetical protein